MNITFEKLDDLNGKLIVTVDEADYTAKVDDELRKIGRTQNIPGFRKGHIALPQLRQRFGKQVKSDIINRVAGEAVMEYLQNEKLDTVGHPIAEEIKEINLNDKEYTFTYLVGLAPALDIKLDKEVHLPYKGIQVSDAMIDEQDQSLRERFGTQGPGEEVDEKALVKGSMVELDAEGQPLEGGIKVENAIVAPSYFTNKAEAEKFAGKKVGETVVFNPYESCNGNAVELSSMLNIDKEKAVEVKNNFALTISEIITLKMAEHNQEFFDQIFGADKVHNEEEYRKAVAEMIAGSLRGTTDYYANIELKKHLMETYGKAELPKEFLKKWLAIVNAEHIDENTDMEEVYNELLPDLTWSILKSKLQHQLDAAITEEDLKIRAEFIARQQFHQYGIYNVDDATVEQAAKRILENADYRRNIANELEDLKLFAAIRNAVTLDVEEVPFDDYKAYAESFKPAEAEVEATEEEVAE